MEMEFMPEFTDAMSRDRDRARQIVRGKRTKRPRPCSPVVSSDCVSSELSTEEDEDMANCLIMLAQSVCYVKEETSKPDQIRQKTDKLSSKRLSELTTNITTTTTASSNGITKAGFYVYECKTCNRAFPSFQALGGHRASHKKPKLNVEEKKSISVNIEKHRDHDQHKVVIEDEESMVIINNNNNNNNFEKEKSLSPPPVCPDNFIRTAPGVNVVIVNNNNNNINNNNNNNNNKLAKVHECSICGSEFLSGQALGGHMRKHRPIPPTINRSTMMMINEETISDDHVVIEKSTSGGGNNMLCLDLNLPPPELVDDHKFQFTTNSSSSSSQQQRLIFSSPALVDCHY